MDSYDVLREIVRNGSDLTLASSISYECDSRVGGAFVAVRFEDHCSDLYEL